MIRQHLSEMSGVELSEVTISKLEAFRDLVLKWNPRINLVSRASLADLWTRHIADSAQLYRYASSVSGTWADLGSGGGFPGVVLAVLSTQAHPDRQYRFVESDQRKAVFLREAVRVTECRASVVCDRIEQVDPMNADVVTARALASLPDLLGLVARHLRSDGLAILPKGANYKLELDAARANWAFDAQVHPSVTDPDGHILQIKGLKERLEDR